MSGRIDAIILAGTENYPRLEADGLLEHKQFLPLGGQPILQYVVDAALGCDEIKRVYVVSDVQRLYRTLTKASTENRKLTLVADSGSFISNIRATFCHEVLPVARHETYHYQDSDGTYQDNRYHQAYLKRNPAAKDHEILILYSDMPFIKTEDITRFLDMRDRKAGLNIGFADSDAMSWLEEQAGTRLARPEFKTEMFPMGETRARFNNLATLKPLRVDPGQWHVAQDVYDSRYFLRTNGEHNHENKNHLKKKVLAYALRNAHRKPHIIEGFLRGSDAVNAVLDAHKGKSREWVPAKEDFEDIVTMVLGINTRIVMSDIIHPLLDIDNAAMYELLRADGERLFRKIRDADRHYEELPWKALERYVAENEAEFTGHLAGH